MTIPAKRVTVTLLLLGLIFIGAVSYLGFVVSGEIAGNARGSGCALSLVQRISLPPGPGRIDHMDVDVAHGRLYVAMLANDSVAVVDLDRGSFLRSVTGLRTPQGVLLLPSANRLLVTNAGDGTVDIFNSTTLEITKVVQLGSDADNIRYDIASGLVYVGYGAGGIAALNATTGQVVSTVTFVGHPESFQLNRNDSKIFVNDPEGTYIVVIDRAANSISGRWPLSLNASRNFPMGLDEVHHRLFVGTRQPAELLVYDDTSGRLVATVGIAQGPDDLYYSGGCIYVSSSQGFLYVIKQYDADHYEVVQTLSTGAGAGTSLFVPRSGRLYVAVPQSTGGSPQVYVYQRQD
jgi:DNA-binding beta-propeller fold protein YncE